LSRRIGEEGLLPGKFRPRRVFMGQPARERMENIITAKEVGQYLKLSESTIYKLASSGEIPGFKVGDSWRFDMEEIQKMIEQSKERCQRGVLGQGGK
jgi:excisionase family DNA binding protein